MSFSIDVLHPPLRMISRFYLLFWIFLGATGAQASVCAWVTVAAAYRGPLGESTEWIDRSGDYHVFNPSGRAALSTALEHVRYLELHSGAKLFRDEYWFWKERFRDAGEYLRLRAKISPRGSIESTRANAAYLDDLYRLHVLTHELEPSLVFFSDQIAAQNQRLATFSASQRYAIVDAYTRYADSLRDSRSNNSETLAVNIAIAESWAHYVKNPSLENRTSLESRLATRFQLRIAPDDPRVRELGQHGPLATDPASQKNYRWVTGLVERYRVLAGRSEPSPWERMELDRAGRLLEPLQSVINAKELILEVESNAVFLGDVAGAAADFHERVRPAVRSGHALLHSASLAYNAECEFERRFRARLSPALQSALLFAEDEAPQDYSTQVGLKWADALTLASDMARENPRLLSRPFPSELQNALIEVAHAAGISP